MIVGLLLGLPAPDGSAQSIVDEPWNPFKSGPDHQAPRRKQPAPSVDANLPPAGRAPADRVNLQREPRNRPVESSDLPPVMAPDASGLPLDLWRGLDLGALEHLLAGIDLPPPSPAMQQLWRRMLISSAPAPAGAPTADHFLALRSEALYRAGLLRDLAEVLDKGGSSSPVAQILRVRVDIGLGARDGGCRAIEALHATRSAVPGRLKGEAQLLVGYCAAAAGDAAAASLAASLAREEGVAADLALTILSNLDIGTRQRFALPARVSLLDYRFLELLGPVEGPSILEKAEPALLVALAGATGHDVRLQIAAAEAALRVNALTPEAVADVYRRLPESATSTLAAQGDHSDPLLRRAQLFRAAEIAQAPELKARHLRTLLADARRAGLHMQTAQMLAPLVSTLWPSPETAVLTETIVEIALAAGDFELARRWAETAANLQHWLALIDIADPQQRGMRPSRLPHVDGLAARGRLSGDTLHRLATVLDALDLEVPMGLWEAAGRTPQPAAGYLPETGVLADLAQSSQRKDVGRAVLVAMRALGPNGAEGANILALGDTVRALKRAGLEADARRLGLEALFGLWPRTHGN